MRPEMTLAVHILAYTIRISLLLRSSFCFASSVQGRRFFLFCCTQIYNFVFRFGRFATDLAALPQIGRRATDLAFVSQIWPLCHRLGSQATDLSAVPQIWRPCHIFGCRATDLAPIPQIWTLCHRFGRCATDLAAVPQTWLPCHRFGHRAKIWAGQIMFQKLFKWENQNKYFPPSKTQKGKNYDYQFWY